MPLRFILIATLSSSFPNFTFQTMNSSSKSTAENRGRNWWLLAQRGEVSGSVGVVTVNFGKMWIGLKYSWVILDDFGWFLGGFGWFLLISGWFRVLLNGFRLFALLILTPGKSVYSTNLQIFKISGIFYLKPVRFIT